MLATWTLWALVPPVQVLAGSRRGGHAILDDQLSTIGNAEGYELSLDLKSTLDNGALPKYMGGCPNYGLLLGPRILGAVSYQGPKKDRNADHHPHGIWAVLLSTLEVQEDGCSGRSAGFTVELR